MPDPRSARPSVVPLWLGNVPVPETFLVGLAAGAWLHRERPWCLPGPRRVQQILGWPIVSAGGYVIARSVLESRRVDLADPDRLVTTGPYAVSRNPMYVGWAVLHLGVGLTSGSGWVLAALPAVLAVLGPQVRAEEHELRRRFGDEFDRYSATVPRYLPGGEPGRL